MTQSDLLTANYCLVLLLRKHLLGLLQDVKDWKEEEQEWIEQDLGVGDDTIEELEITSSDPNIGKILNVINDNINELKGKSYD